MVEQQVPQSRRRPGRVKSTLSGLLLVALAAGLPPLAHSLYTEHQHFLSNQGSATSRVIDTETECYAGFPFGHCSDTSDVSFVTADGQAVIVRISQRLRVGKSVTVYYDIQDPHYAELTADWSAELVIFLVMIVIYWLVAVYFIIKPLWAWSAHRRVPGRQRI